MKKERMKKILVHKQGGNWIANDNGFESPLPYRLVTRQDVIDYYDQINGELLVGQIPFAVFFV